MEFDPVAYLAGKGLRGKPASGGREMTYACFLGCNEPPDSRKKKLYLNVAEGVYQCKVCSESGGPYSLQRHFGDEPRTGTSDDAFMRRRILDAAVQAGQDMLMSNNDVLLYLTVDRGLSERTVLDRRLGFVAGGWSLVGVLPEDVTAEQIKSTGLVHREGPRQGKDFFYRHILIPYLSRGHAIQMRGRAWGEIKGGKYFTGPGEPPRLYGADSLDGAEEVIITEGEFDCMILAQTLAESPESRARKIGVVALPGTSAMPDELNDVLAGAKRIFIGLDSDEPGVAAAERLKEHIGSRARILTLPYIDGRKCDWTEFLLPAELPEGPGDWRIQHPYAGHNWQDVLRLLSTASGKRVFTMAEAGLAYRSFRETNDGLKTGFRGIDSAIQPGLLPGQVWIILAKTGSGKTLYLCNLAYNMRLQQVLFLSLEMTREEVYERLRRIYLFHHPYANDEAIEEALGNIYICDENRLGERDLGVLVNEFKVEAGVVPEVVMVDYLGYFARGARGNSPYEKATNAVMQLKAEAKAGRFVVIAPHQVNRGAKEGKPIDLDDARDSGAVEETADFLFALFRPDDGLSSEVVVNQQPSGKIRCSILKSRHGGKGKVFSFQMDLLYLSIVDDMTPEAKKADDHNYSAWRGYSWEDIHAKESAPRQMKLRDMP